MVLETVDIDDRREGSGRLGFCPGNVRTGIWVPFCKQSL